ncbi:MAG: phosphatase domain-containing protein [Bacteriovoracaceae bacterium]
MKKMTFLVGLLLSLSLQAKVLIITDIDDTVKQTNVSNVFSMILSNFGGTKDFPHMKDVFREIAEHHKNEKIEITFTSGSIKCVTNQKKWLSKREFPAGLLIQRRCNNGEFSYRVPTKDFKIKAVSSLLRQLDQSNHEIYLFGDSGEKDPEVFKAIQEAFPHLNFHVFIRDISAKAVYFDDRLPQIKVEGNNYFLTELDLYNFPDFNFLSNQLKDSLKADLKDGKLFASYQDNILAKRLHKEAGLKKKESKELANTLLRNYYAH